MATPGAKLLVNGNDYDNHNVSIHIVSRDFATKHPEAVKAMYRARQGIRGRGEAPRDHHRRLPAVRCLGQVADQVSHFDVPKILPIDADGRAMLEAQAKEYVDFGFIDEMPDIKATTMDCDA